MESAVEADAPAAAVPEDRCRPPPQTSGALLDEATAAANPFPCGRCRAFHNNDSGYCEKCSSSWLSPGFVARARRLQRRAYLALITLVMSYFETSDRLVLSMFIGSSGLIVLFYLLTQSVATESPTWICGLVAYVAALLYLIPTIRSTVLKVEDIDKISSLFEDATKQSLAGATKDDLRPVPRKLANQLLQPTGDLRQLYVMARARLKAFELEVVEPLARAGRNSTEQSRETKGCQLKRLHRAREKIAMDYDGDVRCLRDILRASVVCETVSELRMIADELEALEAAGVIRVVQVKNRFGGKPTPSGYRDINLNFLHHDLVVEVQIHLRAVLTIADKQHVAYEYAREMDLMGVLEKSEAEESPATRGPAYRRSHWGYFVARLVPAILSVVIGWLYIDAFTLKGLTVVVKRASLLPTRGFSPPYVTLRLYGLILAAPYFTNAYLLLRAAGLFGEKARQHRREKSRIALLYERNFGYDGTYFVWKIFAFQISEVALQAYGKIPLFLTFTSPFGCLRADCSTGFGSALKDGSSASLLHAFVIFFYCALLVNVIYPTFLLRSRHLAYQRDFSFIVSGSAEIIQWSAQLFSHRPTPDWILFTPSCRSSFSRWASAASQ